MACVPLATHFLQCICKDLGREVLRLTKQQTSMMLKHPWPGNVRELRNVLERAVILTRGSRLNLELAMGQSQGVPKSAAAADETESPVIVQASRGARSYSQDNYLRHLMIAASELHPNIPIAMHLDHGNSPESRTRSKSIAATASSW